jgi:uncharacterized membrane protein
MVWRDTVHLIKTIWRIPILGDRIITRDWNCPIGTTTHVKGFGRRFCLVLNGIGPNTPCWASPKYMLSVSTDHGVCVFPVLPEWCQIGPVVFVSHLLEEYATWVSQKVTDHFEVITSGLVPLVVSDIIMITFVYTPLMDVLMLLSVGLIDMAVMLLLLFAMSMLSSGDNNLLPALCAFRSRFPWRGRFHHCLMLRPHHWAFLLGMPITWNVVSGNCLPVCCPVLYTPIPLYFAIAFSPFLQI